MPMKYYAIAEINVKSRRWVPSYIREVTRIVEARGGKYLARTANVEKVEGERALPQLCVLIEWPSREDALAFYNSDEYRPFRDARLAGADNEFRLIAGEDVNQRAAIEP